MLLRLWQFFMCGTTTGPRCLFEITASEIYDPVLSAEIYIGGGGDAVQLSP